MIVCAHIIGADLFGVDVVNAAFGDVNADITVDADVSFHRDFVSPRVVLSEISVNVGVTNVYRHIVSRRGDAVLVSGFSAGSDLYRFVVGGIVGWPRHAGPQNHKKNHPDQLSHGGRRRYRRLLWLQM